MSIGKLFQVKKKLFFYQLHTLRHFYRRPRFALLDLSFGLIALFSNPYRTCRKFLEKKGDLNPFYGETPPITLQRLASLANLTSSDHWIELGSGRGKGCFWISEFIGCRVTGIEWIPQFIHTSRFFQRLLRYKQLDFQCQEMEKADFSKPAVVYLYGTCLLESQVDFLTQKLEALPQGSRILTISYPLSSKKFSLQKSIPVSFPWGITRAYLHSFSPEKTSGN